MIIYVKARFNVPSSLGRREAEGMLLRKMCKTLPVLSAYKGSTEIINNLLIKNNHFISLNPIKYSTIALEQKQIYDYFA